MLDRSKITQSLREIVDDYRNADEEFTDGLEVDFLEDVLALLKEQEAVVRCEDCGNWIPGYITDHDDFIPPKCGKYQQMVGHSAADYCSLAARKESR